MTGLAAPETLPGSCVAYRPDGSYNLQPCPAALGVFNRRRPKRRDFDSGEHDLSVMWVRSSVAPPGFRGSGGYFHGREAHIQGMYSADFARTPLSPTEVSELDLLCQGIGAKNDVAVVERAYGGCAVFVEGKTRAGQPAPQIPLAQLQQSGRRLGTPGWLRQQPAAPGG